MRKIVGLMLFGLLVLSMAVGVFTILPKMVSAYTPHDPIYIDGNVDFTEENGVLEGSGTEIEPYIIEGWEIDAKASEGIKIKNTTVHFIIKNCMVHGGNTYNGISFYNVTNGKIESSTCHNNSNGIYFEKSSNNMISASNIHNNSNAGIYLAGCSNNNVELSTIVDNDYGVYIVKLFVDIEPIGYYVSSSNNRLEGSDLINNSLGIRLYDDVSGTYINNTYVFQGDIGIDISSSTGTVISNSTISFCDKGIHFWSSSYNRVINSSISWNAEYGIKFGYTSSDNLVTYSNISHNNEGILIGSNNDQNPTDIFIHHNNFINNTVQAGDWDIGTHNHWDDGAEGNYWSDYKGNDTNDDGVGDEPYNITLLIIYGGSNPPCNKDYFPLINPIQIAIVSNELPIPDFDYSPKTPTDLEFVYFTDLSYDTDGTIVSRHWEFGDGNMSNDQDPYHKYMDNGTYTITLTVTDNTDATNSNSKEVIVTNVGPNATAGCNKTNITVGDVVSFTGTGYDNDGSITSWFWDFGDGNNSQLQNPTHVYSISGTYTVSLTVTDNDDATATAILTIVVNEDTGGAASDDQDGNILGLAPFIFFVLIAAIIVICTVVLILKKQALLRGDDKPIKANEKRKKRRQKDNKKEWTKCPECKVRLKKNNLKSHIKKVHKK